MTHAKQTAAQTHCQGSVWNEWHWVACPARPKRDGYCLRHHPEVIAQKRAARDAKWEAQNQRLQRCSDAQERVKKARDAVVEMACRVLSGDPLVAEFHAAEAAWAAIRDEEAS